MNKIGLIAGNGRFPFLVAEEIKKNSDQVVVVALKEETDPAIEKLADRITWISLGQFQKLIDFFKSENVAVATMVGQVKHASLFSGLTLDWRAIKMLSRLPNKKTDTLLGAVAEDLAKEGIYLLPSHQYLKHLLPKKGILFGNKLSKTEKQDVEFGYALAKQIAGLDIGQTVVVKDGTVLAVEAMEGTDECIKRAVSLGKDNAIVVKVAKPAQDWRFDLPVIGPRTVQVMIENKIRALAIDADATMMIDKEQLLKRAEKSNLTIIAL